jgi:carbon-monoxide dehydrogenase medium subunit
MLPAQFDYVRPADIQEAVRLLAQYGEDGKLLAGGQSLIPLLKLRFAVPRVLIDIGRLDGLGYIREQDGQLRIGAGVRQSALADDPLIRQHAPVVAAAAPQVSDPIVRNWGTLGGSLAHADPAGDMGSVMIAANAELVALSGNGERVIRARDFFDGPFTTVLRPDEMLVEIRIPKARGRSFGSYHKLERKIGDFATVGVAVSLDIDGGTCRTAGIGLTAVGPTNLEPKEAETALIDSRLDDAAVAQAAQLAAAAAQPQSDLRGSAEYKRDVVRVYVQRALQSARAGQTNSSVSSSGAEDSSTGSQNSSWGDA